MCPNYSYSYYFGHFTCYILVALGYCSNKQVEITAYADKKVEALAKAPARELNAAMNRIRKKFSKEELEKVHLPHPEQETTSK